MTLHQLPPEVGPTPPHPLLHCVQPVLSAQDLSPGIILLLPHPTHPLDWKSLRVLESAASCAGLVRSKVLTEY